MGNSLQQETICNVFLILHETTRCPKKNWDLLLLLEVVNPTFSGYLVVKCHNSKVDYKSFHCLGNFTINGLLFATQGTIEPYPGWVFFLKISCDQI